MLRANTLPVLVRTRLVTASRKALGSCVDCVEFPMEPWSLLGPGMTLFLMLAGELEIVWKPLSLLLLATDDRRLPLLISATSLYFVVILSFFLSATTDIFEFTYTRRGGMKLTGFG